MEGQPLKDRLGRPIRDLRISVTDRCNFRCSYCMPREVFGDDYAFLPRQELLSFEEIHRLTKVFVSMGVKKIRLTGGEPLMRRGLPELIKKILSVEGVEDIGGIRVAGDLGVPRAATKGGTRTRRHGDPFSHRVLPSRPPEGGSCSLARDGDDRSNRTGLFRL